MWPSLPPKEHDIMAFALNTELFDDNVPIPLFDDEEDPLNLREELLNLHLEVARAVDPILA